MLFNHPMINWSCSTSLCCDSLYEKKVVNLMFVETKLTTAEIKKLLTERLEEMGFTPKNASDEMVL